MLHAGKEVKPPWQATLPGGAIPGPGKHFVGGRVARPTDVLLRDDAIEISESDTLPRIGLCLGNVCSLPLSDHMFGLPVFEGRVSD